MKETNCHTYNYCKIIISRSQGTIHCYSRVDVVMEKDEEEGEDLYCIYTLIEIDRRRRRIYAITKNKVSELSNPRVYRVYLPTPIFNNTIFVSLPNCKINWNDKGYSEEGRTKEKSILLSSE